MLEGFFFNLYESCIMDEPEGITLRVSYLFFIVMNNKHKIKKIRVIVLSISFSFYKIISKPRPEGVYENEVLESQLREPSEEP